MIISREENLNYTSYVVKYNNKTYNVVKPEKNTWVGYAGVKLSIRDFDNNLVQDKDIIDNIKIMID